MDEALQALRGDVGSTPQLHLNDGEGGGCELDGGCGVDASLTTAAMRVQEVQAISDGGCRCEGEQAKYGTLGVNPVVL